MLPAACTNIPNNRDTVNSPQSSLTRSVQGSIAFILRKNQTLTFTSDGCRVTVNYAHYDHEAVIVISFAGNDHHPKPSAVSLTSRQYTLNQLDAFYDTLCHTNERGALSLDYLEKIARMHLNK